MDDKKITFGRTKTPEQQPAYTPEQAPENIDNRRVYDFGKKYAVLDYKFQELKQGAVYTAGFNIQQLEGSFIFTTTFYNVYGQEVSTSSVEVPEGTPIESVELDYANKELVIHTVGGDDIIADFSEMINKIETLESEVQNINNTIFMDDVIPSSEDDLNLVSLGEVTSGDLDLGTRGDASGENLTLNSQKTVAFYDKVYMNSELASLNYEVAVGTSSIAPELARTWFQPTEVESSPFSLMGTPTVIEQEVTMGDGPEVNLLSASLDGGVGSVEQEVGTDDTEVNLLAASLDAGSSEQGVGFIEDEYIQSLEGIEPDVEQTPGLSEGEITESTDGSDIELIPGFSENEVR